jgi:hypothetical protein
MTESDLHILLKRKAADELERLGFQVFFEPEVSPIKTCDWRSYRPDIFAISRKVGLVKYLIAECETNPCKSRFEKKNWHGISIQTRFFEELSTSYILVVPFGKISDIAMFRLYWEIWQISPASNEIWKIPRCSTQMSASHR